ncbi:MAG: hypothetical protein H7061_04965 [Bdellovibrionaceae bacterium]|nr:hypothetical protein [Bdellovibrio sp.]
MKKVIYLYGLTFVLSACQTVYVPQAREVKKKPLTGGVIAMPTNFRTEDRQKADLLMTQNCGSQNVKIADEGEVVIGQTTKLNSSTANRDDTRREEGSLFGIPLVSGAASGTNTEQSSVTTQAKEWQVAYDCDSSKLTKKVKR